MKAVYLKKKGNAFNSFEIKEADKPIVQDGTILIKVKSFGLNYADVMARLGLYPEMPPMPCVLGYDVCGEVVGIGNRVIGFEIGDNVVALTRFGGYAQYALTDARVCIKVDKTIEDYKQLAMATQLSTAYCAAREFTNMYEGDTVLIMAAAGGVGLGLVQLALDKKCKVIAVAGQDEKIEFLKSLGVADTINYRKENLFKELENRGYAKKIDFIYDSVGGDYVKKGMKLLNSGGKYVLFGASKLSGPNNILGVAWEAIKFGTTMFSPPQFLMPSKGMIGINMLSLADHKPEVVERCMKNVYELYQQGVFSHIQGQSYSIEQMEEAHDLLESGKSIGKLAITWQV